MSVPNDLTYIPHLKYSAARHDIQSGDLLLCSGNGFFSTLIKSATDSPWSHVGIIVWWNDLKRLMVLESVESIGVRTVPLSSYCNNYNGSRNPYDGTILIARHRHYMPKMTEKLSENGADLLGHKYDKLEIARIARKLTIIAELMREIKEQNCEIPKDNGLYICSEYAYRLYNGVGLNISHSCGFVTPADFANTHEIEAKCVLV